MALLRYILLYKMYYFHLIHTYISELVHIVEYFHGKEFLQVCDGGLYGTAEVSSLQGLELTSTALQANIHLSR